MMVLWRWNVSKDEWEWQTEATSDMAAKVLRNYKRRDNKGVRFRWTEGTKPKKFRTRRK